MVLLTTPPLIFFLLMFLFSAIKKAADYSTAAPTCFPQTLKNTVFFCFSERLSASTSGERVSVSGA
jgi:hypothetical protein